MEGSWGGGPRSPPLLAPLYPQGRRLLGGPWGTGPRPWGRRGGPGWLFSTAPLPPLPSPSLSSPLPSLRRAPSRTHTPSPAPLASPKTPLKATGSQSRGEGRWRGGDTPPPRTPNPNFGPLPRQPSPTPRASPCQGAPGGRRGRGLVAPRDAGCVPVPLAGGWQGHGHGARLGAFLFGPPKEGTARFPTLPMVMCPKNGSWVPRWCRGGGSEASPPSAPSCEQVVSARTPGRGGAVV